MVCRCDLRPAGSSPPKTEKDDTIRAHPSTDTGVIKNRKGGGRRVRGGAEQGRGGVGRNGAGTRVMEEGWAGVVSRTGVPSGGGGGA